MKCQEVSRGNVKVDCYAFDIYLELDLEREYKNINIINAESVHSLHKQFLIHRIVSICLTFLFVGLAHSASSCEVLGA